MLYWSVFCWSSFYFEVLGVPGHMDDVKGSPDSDLMNTDRSTEADFVSTHCLMFPQAPALVAEQRSILHWIQTLLRPRNSSFIYNRNHGNKLIRRKMNKNLEWESRVWKSLIPVKGDSLLSRTVRAYQHLISWHGVGGDIRDVGQPALFDSQCQVWVALIWVLMLILSPIATW